MAFDSFRTQVEQLTGALEAHERSFCQASQAAIPVSLLKDSPTLEAFNSLTDLPFCLSLTGEEPLSLTEARVLFNSALLDTLCSVLSRLEWETFDLEDLDATPHHPSSPDTPRGLTAVYVAVSCIRELLHAWQRVHPPDAAALESFGRCICLACKQSADSPSSVRHVTAAALSRFQSAVPVLQQAVQALARLTTAVAATGAPEHAGNLVLAWVTSNVQQACPCACVSAPMHHTDLAARCYP